MKTQSGSKNPPTRDDGGFVLVVAPHTPVHGEIEIGNAGPAGSRSKKDRIVIHRDIAVQVYPGVRVLSERSHKEFGPERALQGGYQVIKLGGGATEEVQHTYFETLALFHKAFSDFGSKQGLSKPELLKKVAKVLVEEAKTEEGSENVEEAWQAMLVQGMERKTALLKSAQFKSVAQAAVLLSLKEPAVRRRIREHKLIAVKAAGTDESRIPVWALALSPEESSSIHTAAGDMDAWALFHFMDTPHSWLDGMRPFELLLPADSLTPEQLARRRTVAQHFGVTDSGSLLDVVVRALKREANEESEA
jgi:hypothetical protein